MRRVYLDHTATTPLDPRVGEVIQQTLSGTFGNASSIHSFGREAKILLEESREKIAGCIGAKYDELFFTSGGTEADNQALKGVAFAAQKSGKNHVITTAIEHHAVLHSAEWLKEHGFVVDFLPVDECGMVDQESVRKSLKPATCLVSIMHANNEVGTIEPIREISEVVKSHGVYLHSDTVQSVGKLAINVNDLGVDLLAMSAHKFYGPKGIGAIFIRKGTKIDSLIQGGAQESNRRAGTENVPLAVGFAKAIELAMEEQGAETKKFRHLRGLMRKKLASEFPGIIFNGHPESSLPNIVNISFDSAVSQVDGDALIAGLDLRGVAVTSGSACTSGSLQASHVLLAMGRDEQTAKASVRFSFGRGTTEEDIDYAVGALREVLTTMKQKVSTR